MPDVPAENYWYRRHLAVYEWIAGALRRPRRGGHGLRRGLRHRGAGPPRPRGHGRGRQPRGPRARPAQVLAARGVGSSATWWSATARSATPWSSSRRSSTWSARRRCCATSARCSGPGGAAYVSTPNLLTLAPAGAEKSDNPWHLREYRVEEFRALCASVFERVRDVGPLPRAQAAGARAGAARRVGPRARGAGHHQALLRPLHPRDRQRATSRCARAARARARLRGRVCTARDERAPRGARARPAHPHALRGGLRHVALRRGVALGGRGLRVPAAARRSSTARR